MPLWWRRLLADQIRLDAQRLFPEVATPVASEKTLSHAMPPALAAAPKCTSFDRGHDSLHAAARHSCVLKAKMISAATTTAVSAVAIAAVAVVAMVVAAAVAITALATTTVRSGFLCSVGVQGAEGFLMLHFWGLHQTQSSG